MTASRIPADATMESPSPNVDVACLLSLRLKKCERPRTSQPARRLRGVRLSDGLASTSFELVKLLLGLIKEGPVLFILLDPPVDKRLAVSRRCIVLCVTDCDVLLNRIDAPYAKNIVGVDGFSPSEFGIYFAHHVFLTKGVRCVAGNSVVRAVGSSVPIVYRFNLFPMFRCSRQPGWRRRGFRRTIVSSRCSSTAVGSLQ